MPEGRSTWQECNFEVQSDDEGQIYIGTNCPTSRQAQLLENKSRQIYKKEKEMYRKMTAVDMKIVKERQDAKLKRKAAYQRSENSFSSVTEKKVEVLNQNRRNEGKMKADRPTFISKVNDEDDNSDDCGKTKMSSIAVEESTYLKCQ